MPHITLGPHPNNHTGVIPKNAQNVRIGITHTVNGGPQQATIGFSRHNAGDLPIPVNVHVGPGQPVNGVNFTLGNWQVTYAQLAPNSPTVDIAWT